MEEKTYPCYFECDEWEEMDLSQIFYYVKNWKMIEIQVNEDCVLYVRQWKDIPMTYETGDETFEMTYWKLYLTDWTNIYKVWNWRGEDWLAEWLEECKNFNP